MRGRRNRFSRLGLLSLALLLSLCVTGIGYAAWTDELTIDGTAEIGYVTVVLNPGTCSNPEIITCSVPAPHTLVVTLTNAPPGDYFCGFTITNAGTIPVKIQDIVISDSLPDGVDPFVSGVAVGTQIEQAGIDPDSIDGTVFVTVPAGCEGMFSFSITFSFVQWNLYIE